MKDGTTHLAYKSEHVVDVETDFVLAATVHGGDAADTVTLVESVAEAQVNLHAAYGVTAENERKPKKQAAGDRRRRGRQGYHHDEVLAECRELDLRTYIPEHSSKHKRRWTDKPEECQQAVYANRRRLRTDKSKRLQRKRSELAERSFAHVCETGDGRRCWLRGLMKVTHAICSKWRRGTWA